MAGMYMSMGLGGAGAYSGPVYGADGPAAVPASGGYPDTAAGTMMAFGPGGAARPRDPGVHSLTFGVVCFAALIFFAWALPR